MLAEATCRRAQIGSREVKIAEADSKLHEIESVAKVAGTYSSFRKQVIGFLTNVDSIFAPLTARFIERKDIVEHVDKVSDAIKSAVQKIASAAIAMTANFLGLLRLSTM